MLLSLDFPRDGEVLEPSGNPGEPGTGPPTHSTWLRVVVSIVEPRLKHSGVTPFGILIADFLYLVSLFRSFLGSVECHRHIDSDWAKIFLARCSKAVYWTLVQYAR